MKKILIVSCVFPPEPVVSARLSSGLAKALSKHFMVSVIKPKPTRPQGYAFGFETAHHDFHIIQTDSFTSPKSTFLGRLIEIWSFGKAVACHIKENSHAYDLIYQNSWPLFAQFLVANAAAKADIPLITHVQDVYPESILSKVPTVFQAIFRPFFRLDKYVLQHSAHVFAISKTMANYLKWTRKLIAGQVSYVYNWQALELYSDSNTVTLPQELIVDVKSQKIMYLGNIGPLSNLQEIVPLFLSLNTPQVLIIAGAGSLLNELKRIVSLHMNRERVLFYDVPLQFTGEFMKQADICFLPMKSGQGNFSIPSKLIGYYMAKKPVLAITDSKSDTGKMISDADAGWVVEAGRNDELSNRLSDLTHVSSSSLTAKGQNGFDFAVNHFSE